MDETLYIFVTSERPDQYLNPILHCLQHMNLSKIVFLRVDYKSVNENNEGNFAKVIRENVESFLTNLSEGKYRYFIGKRRGQTYDLANVYPLERLASIKEKYSLLRSRKVSWQDMDINYYKLRQELAAIHKKEPHAIFDVTAISKEYLGDIFAISIVEGIDQIYTFVFKEPPDYDIPWKFLYHELDLQSASGYRYSNLTEKPIYIKCSESILVRRPPFVISLLSAFTLLITLIIVSLIFGPTSWFVLFFSGLATVASILSVFFTFFPLRR